METDKHTLIINNLLIILFSITPILIIPQLLSAYFIKSIFFILIITMIFIILYIKSVRNHLRLFKNNSGYSFSYNIILILFLSFIIYIAAHMVLKKSFRDDIFNSYTYLLCPILIILMSYQKNVDLKKIIRFPIIISGFISLIGILQLFRINLTFINLQQYTRYHYPILSTIGNPNFLGYYIVSLLPFLFCYYKKNIIYKIILILNIVAIYFSYSRGVWITFSLVLILLFIKKIKFDFKIILFSVLFIICIIIFSPFTKNIELPDERIKGIFSRDNYENNLPGDLHGRLLIYKLSLEIIADNPLGIGNWNFRKHYLKKQKDFFSLLENKYKFKRLFIVPNYAHNEFLQYSVDYGIPAGILFFCISILMLYIAFKALKNQKDPNNLLFPVFISQLSILTASLFSFPLHILPNVLIFIFNTAYIINLNPKKKIVMINWKKWQSGLLISMHTLFIVIIIIILVNCSNIIRQRFYINRIYNSENLSEAKFNIEKLETLNKDNMLLKYFSGLYHKFSGEYDSAIKIFKNNKDIYIDFVIYANIGECYFHMNKFNLALNYFNKTLAHNPFHRQTLNNIALTYYKKGNYKKALEYLNTALSLYPNNTVLKQNIKIIKKAIN